MLIQRFLAEPGTSVFSDLANALLARGHATEALRVAEQGLEHLPTHLGGRIERASANLALGRPRVAYVELLRVLTIDPRNRRALRLLGQAYKDAGVPERAARLLTQRLADEPEGELEVTAVTQVPNFDGRVPRTPEVRRPEPQEGKAPYKVPDLFSELTKDLGLGSDASATKVRRVEVTQIIRRRGPLRPSRTNSELLAIEGPIVDKTQPGELAEDLDEIGDREPAGIIPADGVRPSLLDAAPAPALGAYDFEEGDVLTEHAPFAIRPVELDASDRWANESDQASARQHAPSGGPRDARDTREAREARDPRSAEDAGDGTYRRQRSRAISPLSPASGSEDPTTISSGSIDASLGTSRGRSSVSERSSPRGGGESADATMRPTEPLLEAVSDRAGAERASMATAPLAVAAPPAATPPPTPWHRAAWIGALVVVVLLFAFVVILWYSGERGPQ